VSEPPVNRPVVTALGSGRFLVDTSTGRCRAFAATVGTTTWVFVDGHVHVHEQRADPSVTSGSAFGTHEDQLASPMPATVIAVSAAPGQRVTRGDILVRLEAMKMELQIVALRDGVVATVTCHVGDLVQPGVPLVVLDPAGEAQP
jgi:3-methylcrotonyl-CoA carboxylase alpha subunit